MPNEVLINQIESMLDKIIRLGGENERTSITPNLTVVDANPVGLDGFIIVSDDRDGDNILAKKVGSIVYSDNDKINTMFVKGGEAIAFQQGSESPSTGDIWEIVPSATDIFYNKGDVGIGKSVAPDATLEVLSASQAQLRLTHTEDTKFVDFTLDTSHDLTITPSSTGQIILQPTTDSVDFFQVLDANGGTPVLNVDSTNERVGINEATPSYALHVTPGNGTLPSLPGSGNGLIVQNNAGASDNARFILVGGATGNSVFNFGDTNDIDVGAIIYDHTNDKMLIRVGGVSQRFVVDSNGRLGVNILNPLAQLHVNQSSASAAIPATLIRQADVSEEMIEFDTTIGTGNAIEAVGAKALTTTHFIKVTLPGSLTRYIPAGTIA